MSTRHQTENQGSETAFLLAHMNMLQAAISRLTGNSASCKTWCSGLVVALWGLSAVRAPQLLPLTLVPVLALAFLDAAYLAQERRFRKQFEAMAEKGRDGTYTREHLFIFGEPSRGDQLDHLAQAAVSWSIWPYYGGLAAACIWASCVIG